MKNAKTTVCAVALAWCAIALTCLAPYEWLVGPPRDLFWRYWLPGLLPPLFFLVTVSFARPDLDLLCCDLAGCLVYWVGFSLLTNLVFYSPSATDFCLGYNSREMFEGTYQVTLVGPSVSGCSVSAEDVRFEPEGSASVARWDSVNDFVVVVPTLDYTTMSVACRGRHLRACDRVPGATNFSDWRQQVPFVPHAPFALVHTLVWVLVLMLFVRVICCICIRESNGQVQGAEESSEEALLSAP